MPITRPTKKPKIPKRPMGRPTKLTKEIIPIIEMLTRRGFTELEICQIIGVDESTFTKWKQRKPDFFTALKDWKLPADGKIEASLYERAKGFKGPDGKFYPPDPTSMIFWLKNRHPDKWRDKREHSFDGPLEIVVERERV